MSPKCPHCTVAFHLSNSIAFQTFDVDGGWSISEDRCPSCDRLVLRLRKHPIIHISGRKAAQTSQLLSSELVRPRTGQRPLPSEIPELYAKDFREAVDVLHSSPRASAALSRFCLQKLLREEAKVNRGDLSDEIQQVIDSGKLPSAISESIDAIRNIGNFAAHPNKSKSTGEITDVEPEEAEWTLEVLEALFDYYLVQPSLIAKKRELLNQKLKDTGKPPMK